MFYSIVIVAMDWLLRQIPITLEMLSIVMPDMETTP